MKLIPSLFGLSGVILGALGAHALKPKLAALGTVDVWQTASQYQLIHAVALLAVAVALLTEVVRARPALARWLRAAMHAWTAGIILFSGSLYWVALGGPRWLWPLAPLGGLALMAGWACIFIGACKEKQPAR